MRTPRPSSRRPFALAFLLVGLALAGLGLAYHAIAARPRPETGMQGPRPTLDGGIDWINTDRPIHLDKLRGKVVLLDFWTYCCINCHHIIPTLSKLEAKYKDQLVVIGVHTAKFAAERQTENIRKKVREFNIKHPVVNDADQVIWNNFGVEAWPTLVLLNVDGRPVGKQGGEVSYEILDRAIGSLVERARTDKTLDETPIQFYSERDRPHNGPLLFPGKVVADVPGNRLFISDTGHNRVVIADLDGKPIDYLGNGIEALADGPFGKASLNRPQGICLVGETLYIADTENHALRAADLKAKTIKTVAGNGKQAEFGATGGRGAEGALSSPWDVLPIPGTKLLALAMAGTHQIWSFDTETGMTAVIAGSGRENIVDGPPADAAFAQPSGLATDGKSLFVADSEVSGVRSIALGTGNYAVDRIVGNGLFAFGDVDGAGRSVKLQHCLGLAYGGGKLYIADSYNNKVKVCDPATKAVKTLAGSMTPGSTDEPALFDEPGGLSVAGNSLYVADTNNHKIRVVALDTGKVRTLSLDGMTAPRTPRVPTFKNPVVATVDPIKVGPGKSFTLTLTLPLPKGFDLNADAPIIYLVEAPDQPGALSDQNPKTGGRIEKPESPFTVPIPLAAVHRAGETLNLRVSVQAMICLPNTLCTSKCYVWNVPVTFAEGAPTTAPIGSK